MTHKRKHVNQKTWKMELKRFKVPGRIIAVIVMVLCAFALQQIEAGSEIDLQKDVYLFLHGKTELKEKAINILVSKGFSKEKITVATPDKVGNVGDYMAILWKPPNPDHIKIQQITRVEEVEPDEIIGLWKGVSRVNIDTIPLE